MPTYLVRHVTTYRYAAPVAFGEHRFMLRPRESHDQRSRSTSLVILPVPVETRWTEDAWGNLVGHARFGAPARELRFEALIEVEQTPLDAGSIRVAEHARACPLSYGSEDSADLGAFLERQHRDSCGTVVSWAQAILDEDPARDSYGLLCRMTDRIHRTFVYRHRFQGGIQHPSETLSLGSGSCRDFAVLMADAVRSLGFAARFVSGYLYMPSIDAGNAAMAGHTHAWTQVYLPGAGWIDFDPTCGSIGNEGLVRVAAVRKPSQAIPLSGTFFGAAGDFLEMNVEALVTRTDEGERPDRLPARAA